MRIGQISYLAIHTMKKFQGLGRILAMTRSPTLMIKVVRLYKTILESFLANIYKYLKLNLNSNIANWKDMILNRNRNPKQVILSRNIIENQYPSTKKTVENDKEDNGWTKLI